jgi:putative FmdB family regulatory protein
LEVVIVYEYECSVHGVFEVIKSHKLLDKEEKCPVCNFGMKKLISVPGSVQCSNFKPEFYHAFGKKIHSKRELKNELSKIKHETGKELVEVGNDSMKSVKRTRHRLPSTREIMEREKWT